MNSAANPYLLAADAILVMHFVFAAFIVLGLAFIRINHPP